jgi:3-hydroxybutyrate dehydrogenase
VNILVKNASIQHTAPVDEVPAKRWDLIIAINLSATCHAIRAVLPQLRGRSCGRLINIALTYGLVASATKALHSRQARPPRTDQGRRARNRQHQGNLQRNLPRLGFGVAGQKQIDNLAARQGLTAEAAKLELLGVKQSSRKFGTPEQIGALAVLFCSVWRGADPRCGCLEGDLSGYCGKR